MSARILMGDEAAVVERIGELRAMGIDGLAVNMPADGWDLDAVRYAGKVLLDDVLMRDHDRAGLSQLDEQRGRLGRRRAAGTAR